MDVSILACDVPAFREFVGDRWHLWSQTDRVLRSMNDLYPDLPEPDAQIWVRRDACRPGCSTCRSLPTSTVAGATSRSPDHVAPLEEVTWLTDDGVRMLEPGDRAAATRHGSTGPRTGATWIARCPCSTTEQRTWLRDAVRRLLGPDHPWLDLTRATENRVRRTAGSPTVLAMGIQE